MKMNEKNYETCKKVFDYILENADDTQALYILGCLNTCFEVALKDARKEAKKNGKK